MNLGFRDNSYWAWCFLLAAKERKERKERQDQSSCLPIPSLCSMRSFAAKIIQNSEVEITSSAFGTTETLRATEGTEFFRVGSRFTDLCIQIFLSVFSGSQCFSGNSAGIREMNFGFRD